MAKGRPLAVAPFSGLFSGISVMQIISVLRNVFDRRFQVDKLIISDKTPYKVILKDGLMSLRYYPPLTEAKKEKHIPVLLVPPLGVPPWVFDLLTDRSLVRYLLEQGFKVYLVNWGEPGREDAHLSLEKYVLDWLDQVVKSVCEHARTQSVSLVGYCMGGLLSLMYAGLSQQKSVGNLVTIASPIDFHDDQSPGGRFLSRLNKLSALNPIKIRNLSPKLYHVPGSLSSILFKLTNPVGQVTSYLNLLSRLADRSYVIRHTTISRWFNEMYDYPGATARALFFKIGLGNQLAEEKLKLSQQAVKFQNITCPILVLAGEEDRIVSIGSAKRSLDLVASTDKAFRVVPGGHAGILAGEQAMTKTWEPLADWLALRS